MKTIGKAALLLAAITFISAVPVFAQGTVMLRANIEFSFMVGNATLPAGNYDILKNEDGASIRFIVRNVKEPKAEAIVNTITMIARGDRRPNDAELIFDKVGEQYVLSEVWMPSVDGFVVHITREAHSHNRVKASRKTATS